jgi:polysaccharide export outer membrane protein
MKKGAFMRKTGIIPSQRIVIVVAILMASLLAAQVSCAEDYKIAPSDILEISVYGEETVTKGELIVRPDGKISYPMAGDVEVAGLSTSQAKDAIEQRVREYIPGAMITVIVAKLNSLQYYVVGKVAKPGMYNMPNSITVLQALALAGGLTTFADENDITIVRKQGNEDLRLPFDYKKVKKGKNLEQNILLERGDVVLVP